MIDNFSVDLSQVDTFVEKAGKLVFQPDAEDALIKLLQLRDLLDLKIGQVKQAILQAGQTIDPNFKGVLGDKIKATARTYGAKYEAIDPAVIPIAYKEETRVVKLKTARIDEYCEKFGTPPTGIGIRSRPYQLSLSPTEHGKKEISGEL